MANLVKTMLNSLYGVFLDKFSDNIEAWDNFIEFIAADHSPLIFTQLSHNFEWLIEDIKLIDKVFSIYKPHLLQEKVYDYLGEVFRDNCVKEKYKDNFLMSNEVSQAYAVMTIGKTDKEINILEPMAHTGRRILSGFELSPNARFFGVESDIRLSRIALTNILIYNINGYILHANRDFHVIDLSKEMGIHNWKHSNNWYSQTDKLKPKLVDMPSNYKK